MSYIGLAATLGVAVDIPPIVRMLTTQAVNSDAVRQLIDAGPEVNDAAAAVTEFMCPWWLPGQLHDLSEAKFFQVSSAKEFLNFHLRQKREVAEIAQADETTAIKDLFKHNYMFPSSAFGEVPVPPGVEPCTRCRLYRAVALGSQDKLRDLRNSIEAGKSIFRLETQLKIREASSFNQLYEAAVSKEGNTVDLLVGEGAGPATTVNKGKKRVELAEDWRALSEERLKKSHLEQSLPSGKWVWGPDLTEDDLKSLVRGGDRNNVLPHTGYDESLDEKSIGYPSPPVNVARFAEEGDPPFFELSPDIMEIPHLETHQYPSFRVILLGPAAGAHGADQGRKPAGAGRPSKKSKGNMAIVDPSPLLPLPPKDYVKLPGPIKYASLHSTRGMYVKFIC